MEIVGVRVSHQYRGLALSGWEQIKQALYVYASGISKSARATENHQIDAIAQTQGGFAAAFYALAAPHIQAGSGNSFVDRMVTEAISAVSKNGKWHRSYDYDGEGSFFKTSVEVELLDPKANLLALNIWAAYVGDKPEVGLAEYLGIERNLLWSSVTLEVSPVHPEKFLFNFDEVLTTLGRVGIKSSKSGSAIVRVLMSGDRYESPKPPVIFNRGGLDVTLGPGRVESRFVYPKPGKPVDSWVANKGTLMGLLDESYQERGKKETPTIVLSVGNEKKDTYGHRMPIWQPEQKQAVLKMSAKIARAFGQ